VNPLTEPGGTLGMILPTLPQGKSPKWNIPEVAGSAEQTGAMGLWVCDHLAWHTPVMECFTALALASGATSKATLGTGVLQLALRPAPLVAKTAASIQLAASGRFILGVGVGLHEGEYDAMDAGFHSRGKRTEEAIATLRDIWRDGTPKAYPSDRYRQEPLPDEIPIWIGGSSDASRRRAAKSGDGWMPLFVAADEMSSRIKLLRNEAEDFGRDPAQIVSSMVLFVSTAQGAGAANCKTKGLEWMGSLYGISAAKFERHLVSGTPSQCAGTFREYFDAGVQHLVLFITDDQPLEQFGLLAQEIPESVRPGSDVAASDNAARGD